MYIVKYFIIITIWDNNQNRAYCWSKTYSNPVYLKRRHKNDCYVLLSINIYIEGESLTFI